MTQMSIPTIKTSIDRAIHALEGKVTQGISPASVAVAYIDWLTHMLHSPGKIGEMSENLLRKNIEFHLWCLTSALDENATPYITSWAGDRRFSDPVWKTFPFNVFHQAFLLNEQWWNYATHGIPGVSDHHESMVAFGARQMLDIFSPTNFFITNPVVQRATAEQGGQNLVRGMENLMRDFKKKIGNESPDTAKENAFVLGKDIATTKGKVVFRNRLIEVIQYSPTTAKVDAEPILIVPAWIMKYYILDLSPHNSMVKFLVDKGHTVFMISWHNPTEVDRDLDMEDYVNLGVMAAVDTITTICPDQKVHSVGYCLGGTLLTIAAAAMARDGDERLKSVSLFTTQTDFTEAGELMLFIDESQISYMEDLMWDRGYLDCSQMAGAFQLLRSNDLIWSRMVSEYLLGETPSNNDLMTWNSDATRMPYRMHAQYLRSLFLNNDLATGRFQIKGKPIAISDIRTPIFAVATSKDHVAPWKSVYKLHLMVDTDVTFVLASGGHNAGIVSEPGHARRHYQIACKEDLDKYISPEDWQNQVPHQEGSWWEPWEKWLTKLSSKKVAPPTLGAPDKGLPVVCDAPGTYVFEK